MDGTALLPGYLRPKLFPGIGVLPGPATESHVVKRGTPVALWTAATECPGEEEPPAWEAPAAQISQRVTVVSLAGLLVGPGSVS